MYSFLTIGRFHAFSAFYKYPLHSKNKLLIHALSKSLKERCAKVDFICKEKTKHPTDVNKNENASQKNKQ